MSFFLYILSSSQDKMHCQLSLTVCICTPCQRASFNSTTDSFSWGHDPYTLACKARPSFDRCGTSLSVSLSLSLSLSPYTSFQFLFCHPKSQGAACQQRMTPEKRQDFFVGVIALSLVPVGPDDRHWLDASFVRSGLVRSGLVWSGLVCELP